jgi:TRAP-type C4-dicarboxylate transport system permease small subunit
MNPIKILAIVLIAGGLLGLLYGGFTYTQDSHDLKIGSLELSVKDKKTVNIPMWAGAGAVATGAALLILRPRSS